MNMRPCKRTILLAAALMAALSAMLAPAVSSAQGQRVFFPLQPTSRAGHWDFYAGPTVLMSETVDFKGGSVIEVDDDLGLAFGFGYNFTDQFTLSGEMSWNSVDYEGLLASADDPPGDPRRLSGKIDVGSLATVATWHFSPGRVTPYANASLGWTWIDTNIATGPPQVGCWWDPWFGFICAPRFSTVSEEAWSYGLGVGMRWDFNYRGGHAGLFRIGYERKWVDLDNTIDTPGFDAVRIEFGVRF